MTVKIDEVAIEKAEGAGMGARWPALLSAASQKPWGLALLAIGGSFMLLPMWLFLLRLWATDPLRMIGAIFPLVALAGVMAAWRRLDWRLEGSAWGFVPIAASIVCARIVSVTEIQPAFGYWHSWAQHPGPVLFLYGVGCTLLFGGPRLLREAIAPLCVLLFINPVPEGFNALVDLPLQQLSANTARGFARMIGLHPTGAQLQMMFAPDFGILIVPGCNGVRGSVTFAYLTLFFGYARHLRVRMLALLTVSAFLLGYALNLLRLCVLMIYYRIGVAMPSIQDYGVQMDYAIGCAIFLFATLSLGYFIRSVEPQESSQFSIASSQGKLRTHNLPQRTLLFAALLCACLVRDRQMLAAALPLWPNQQAVLQLFPAQVGAYRLERTYTEQLVTGITGFAMADYAAPAQADGLPHRLTFGLWLAAGPHNVALSKAIQGLHPISSTTLNATAQNDVPVQFSLNLYNDGISQEFDADALCYNRTCAHTSQLSPSPKTIAFASIGRHLPLLLKREMLADSPDSLEAARTRFEADAQDFTAHLDVGHLVDNAGTQP